MADAPIIPMGDDSQSASVASGAGPYSPERAKTARVWQTGIGLSSARLNLVDRAEAFLANAGFDRAPWLAVAFACGILSWVSL